MCPPQLGITTSLLRDVASDPEHADHLSTPVDRRVGDGSQTPLPIGAIEVTLVTAWYAGARRAKVVANHLQLIRVDQRRHAAAEQRVESVAGHLARRGIGRRQVRLSVKRVDRVARRLEQIAVAPLGLHHGCPRTALLRHVTQ